MNNRWSAIAVLAATGTAILGSLCCIGPFVLVGLGVGAGGLLAGLEAHRSLFTGFTIALLAVGVFVAYRSHKQADCDCEPAKYRRIFLWLSVPLAIGLIALPYVAKSRQSKACCAPHTRAESSK